MSLITAPRSPAWFNCSPSMEPDDDGPEVFVCHECGHETTDGRELCHCERAELRAHGLLPFAWEERLLVACEMDDAFGPVPEAAERAAAGDPLPAA